ncbi:hypothetical protein [Thiohalorhabdus methylotrophus]|uniref:Uncharacterized protein n=1 Tax=Thiohalorhabdus methylotrophus TaxID=3242694 RepID=A0ABV4U142_9GAMM
MADAEDREIQRHIRDRVPFDNPFPEDDIQERYHDFGLYPVEYTVSWPRDYEHRPPEPFIELFWDHRDNLWVLRRAYEDGVDDTSTMWPFSYLEEMEQKEIRNFLWQYEIQV